MSREPSLLPAALVGVMLILPGANVGAERESYRVDAEGSRLRVELGRAGLLKMLGHDHTLEAPIAEGEIEADHADIGLSRVHLRFEARRLAVVPGTEPEQDIPEVEAKMRGAEVLDVERHPQIVFTSTSVAPLEPAATGSGSAPTGVRRLRVRGTLELKGRATAIELPLEVHLSPGALVAKGDVALNLRDLGLEPPSVAGVVKVANRFKVSFEIRARVAPGPSAGPGASELDLAR